MSEELLGYISPETGETAWVQRRNKKCTHRGPCPPIRQAARAEPPITVVRFLAMFAVAVLMWVAIIAGVIAAVTR